MFAWWGTMCATWSGSTFADSRVARIERTENRTAFR
jgi:hypothetical protein